MSYDDTLDALAHELRRQILALLRERPRSVGELAEGLPVSQPAISQHLKVLREAGLVSMEPDGTRHIYHLDRRGLDPLRVYVDSFWEDPLDAYRKSFRPGAPGRAPRSPGSKRWRGHPSPVDEKKRR